MCEASNCTFGANVLENNGIGSYDTVSNPGTCGSNLCSVLCLMAPTDGTLALPVFHG